PALREIEGTRCRLKLRKVHAEEQSTCLVARLHRALILAIQQQARLIELAVLSLPVRKHGLRRPVRVRKSRRGSGVRGRLCFELDRAPVVTGRVSNPEKGLVHAERRESGRGRVEVSGGLGDAQRFRRAVDSRLPSRTEVLEGREAQENVDLATMVARNLTKSLLRVGDRLS